MNNLSYAFVAAAAILWGIIGFFVNRLYEFGITPIQVVSIRAIVASAALVSYLLISNKKLLLIKPGDIKYFIGTGILSFAFFNWCLFIAYRYTSISVATILLYTAPAIVMVLSAILFKEKLTKIKILSLLLTFAGCLLVTGFSQDSSQKLSVLGILAGLGAGLGYALYSIFGKYALEKYDPMTIPVYTFLVAGAGLIPLTDYSGLINSFSNIHVVLYAVGIGLLSTALPFILYTKGLSRLEPSKASLIATLEPVVASIIGFTIFNETVTFSKIIGILLVIAALMIIREKPADTQNCDIS